MSYSNQGLVTGSVTSPKRTSYADAGLVTLPTNPKITTTATTAISSASVVPSPSAPAHSKPSNEDEVVFDLPPISSSGRRAESSAPAPSSKKDKVITLHVTVDPPITPPSKKWYILTAIVGLIGIGGLIVYGQMGSTIPKEALQAAGATSFGVLAIAGSILILSTNLTKWKKIVLIALTWIGAASVVFIPVLCNAISLEGFKQLHSIQDWTTFGGIAAIPLFGAGALGTALIYNKRK